MFCLLLLGLVLFGCEGETTVVTTIYDYPEFSDLFITDPSRQLQMLETEYYIYYFGFSCGSCTTIKEEVLGVIAGLTTDRVYLVAADTLDDVDPLTGVTETPSLLYVFEGTATALYDLPTEVLEALHTLS